MALVCELENELRVPMTSTFDCNDRNHFETYFYIVNTVFTGEKTGFTCARRNYPSFCLLDLIEVAESNGSSITV